jgi:hypothetical protein
LGCKKTKKTQNTQVPPLEFEDTYQLTTGSSNSEDSAIGVQENKHKKTKHTSPKRLDERLLSPSAVPPVACCPCSLFAFTPVLACHPCSAEIMFLNRLTLVFSFALDSFTVLCFGNGNNDNNNSGKEDKGKEYGAKAIARVALAGQW